MKRMHRLLNYLQRTKRIDVADFYSVAIGSTEITLQGFATKENIKKYAIGAIVDENGYIHAEKGTVRIVLT